ncbi:regulator of K conductance [[Clostridium] sordellii]|uniref:Regulator of K conductance n=1 Tax=Paraclostridium sordellii TaxID=1505 RepID=A0A0A1SNJ4_PARSO|nr:MULTISPECIES: TrkA family potassium uptake protein [Paeniclostridium]EPZ60884.1 alanine dehydrogenase/PNT, C-terminal domain protein [[Clostridium] sordellii ATCC 9714] [Paeniclostridium sordellii ATCC 9714]AUN15623.1 potassium transporter Trk [Paeniclostridium sordellii]EPZ60679.1 alanine dehydrogenase/PNT, C-terminal domain protein [[Clostridium] sordellii VPI 9048] [Paeniclostridium sordellii VPI 9048]MBS6024134.1 TrkA family potassium uptake protein [Paeniclostridium sordellii]MBW486131
MKQYIVIGCGRFGSSVATTMHLLGHQVMAIDKNDDAVQAISEKVTHAAIVDVTDEQALRALGMGNFDVAIIAIGSDIRASIMATLIAKEMGVEQIVCKAKDELQAKVLYKIGADRVVFPERDMGVRVAHNLVSNNILDHIELDPDYSIVEIVTPKEWEGKTLIDLDLRAKYEITVLAIKCGKSINVTPSPEEELKAGSILVVIGQNSKISTITADNDFSFRRK